MFWVELLKTSLQAFFHFESWFNRLFEVKGCNFVVQLLEFCPLSLLLRTNLFNFTGQNHSAACLYQCRYHKYAFEESHFPYFGIPLVLRDILRSHEISTLRMM
mgnify:FL=1